MKRLIFTSIAILMVISGFSQDTNRVYFDGDWNKTTKDKALYYRVLKKMDSGFYQAKDYYANTNKLQWEGIFSTLTPEVEHGKSTWYFESGKLDGGGTYNHGKKTGKWKWFYESGKKLSVHYFKNGKKEKKWVEWYENGLKKFVRRYKNGNPIGTWKSWHKNGVLASVKYYKNGKEYGVWTCWHPNGQKAREANFTSADVNWKYWDEEGKVTTGEEQENDSDL